MKSSLIHSSFTCRNLSLLSRISIATSSALIALNNPLRQDMVAAIAETTSLTSLTRLRDSMLVHKTGRKILRTRPLINVETIDFEKLSTLKQSTFGYAYYRFVKDNNVSPMDRVDVKYIDDEELAYVMLRYRQTHDFFHVLTGIPITVEGGYH
jgi:ubiquinone biosynthesis protein COQ4